MKISVSHSLLWQCQCEAYESPHEEQSEEGKIPTALSESLYSDWSFGRSFLRDLHQRNDNPSSMGNQGCSKCKKSM